MTSVHGEPAKDTPTEQAWELAETQCLQLFDELGATEDVATQTTFLTPTSHAPKELARLVGDDGDWDFTVTESGGLFAMPVQARGEAHGQFLLAALHTTLCAWLLSYSWRIRQLAAGTREAYSAQLLLPAASLARPLVEAAAALFSDTLRFRQGWQEAKSRGLPGPGEQLVHEEMLELAIEIVMGAKFDGRVPDLAETYGRIGRTNVLGQIDKVARHGEADLVSNYQWLCNIVHPSAGHTLTYTSPALMHDTGTHIIQWWGAKPLRLDTAAGSVQHSEVTDAISGAAAGALRVAMTTWNYAVRLIDDYGLTTGAGRIVRHDYWRKPIRAGRNEPCTCRSGRKAKVCDHAWGGTVVPPPTDLA